MVEDPSPPGLEAGCWISSRSPWKFEGQAPGSKPCPELASRSTCEPGTSSGRKMYSPDTRFGFAVVFFQSANLRAYWSQSSCDLESGSTRRPMQTSEKARKKSRCQLIIDICKLSARRMLVASLT